MTMKTKELLMTLEEIRAAAAPACAELRVKRLDVFGSLARGEAGPDSDVDLLVEFEEPSRQLHRRYFCLLHRLEDTLGRKIDLLTLSSLQNPYFRRRVFRERTPIYGG
jgi:predicted nucleotidyltransferase